MLCGLMRSRTDRECTPPVRRRVSLTCPRDPAVLDILRFSRPWHYPNIYCMSYRLLCTDCGAMQSPSTGLLQSAIDCSRSRCSISYFRHSSRTAPFPRFQKRLTSSSSPYSTPGCEVTTRLNRGGRTDGKDNISRRPIRAEDAFILPSRNSRNRPNPRHLARIAHNGLDMLSFLYPSFISTHSGMGQARGKSLQKLRGKRREINRKCGIHHRRSLHTVSVRLPRSS